jgi:hypothetical protein
MHDSRNMAGQQRIPGNLGPWNSSPEVTLFDSSKGPFIEMSNVSAAGWHAKLLEDQLLSTLGLLNFALDLGHLRKDLGRSHILSGSLPFKEMHKVQATSLG